MSYIGAGISRFNTADELTVTGDAEFNGNANFGDSDKVSFSSGKLEMYHDGTNAYIDETYANGTFLIRGNNISLQKYTGETMIQCVSDGKVELNFNNVPKLETTSSGVDVTGGLNTTGNVSINTTSGNEKLNVQGAIGSSAASAAFGAGLERIIMDYTGSVARVGHVNGASGSAKPVTFLVAGAEKARLDASGNLLVGKTSSGIGTEGIELRANDDVMITQSGDTCLYLNRLSSDGGIIDLRKDGSTVGVIGTQNWGIGTASPSTTLHAKGATASGVIRAEHNSSGVYAEITGSSGNAYLATGNNPLLYEVNSGEKGRIDTNGFHFGGTDNNPQASSSSSGGELYYSTQYAFMAMYRPSNPCLLLNRTGSDGELVQFRKSGSTVGTVSVTGSGTTYNTSSDRRLKSNIEDAASASDKIDAIQVRQFDWNVDDSHQDYGLIAQELQPIEPLAVSGDADSDEMMAVDYSKLVPMLIKEIQELRSRVAALEE